jgi:hypothetical protein
MIVISCRKYENEMQWHIDQLTLKIMNKLVMSHVRYIFSMLLRQTTLVRSSLQSSSLDRFPKYN